MEERLGFNFHTSSSQVFYWNFCTQCAPRATATLGIRQVLPTVSVIHMFKIILHLHPDDKHSQHVSKEKSGELVSVVGLSIVEMGKMVEIFTA